MATTYRHIGKRIPRKDARDIVTGRAKYINDLKIEHMLFGKVLRSPHPHANIKSIDTTKAEALKGVKTVLTYKNLPGDWKAGLPPSVPVLDKKVRFVGDAVALVAATTEEIAEKACELIKVEYEPLRAAYDVDDAISRDAVPLYAQFPNNTLPPGCPQFGPKALSGVIMGDTEKGFREADFITEGTYAFENIPNPNPPEPPGAIVKWTGPKSLTVWTVGHHAYMIRWKMQPRLDFADVRAIVGPTGGSYGSKCVSTQVILYAAALAKVTHRPVKIYYSKKEHLNTFVLRFGSRIRGKVGIKKDGTITAMEGEWRVNTGAWSEITQGQVAVGCGEVQLMMRCKNWNLKSKVVVSNRSAGGIIRGFGGQELKSAFLPILTLAMEKANLDPVQFFKKNFVHPGDGYYWRDGNWYVYRGPAFDKAIEQGA